MSDVSGIGIRRVALALPRYGAWRASVELVGAEAPTGAVTLTVGDLSLVGTVVEGGLDSTDAPSVAIEGAPGWKRPLEAPLSYQSDGGVRLRTVVSDLASRAGEPVEQPVDVDLGRFWGRAATGRLRDVLSVLRLRGRLGPWRVDPDGVTRFGVREGGEASQARVLSRKRSLGLLRVGTESPADLLPGKSLEGEAIERVFLVEEQGRLRAEVWT